VSDAKLVEIVDLKKHYMLGETRVDALRGVSFTINQGEFMAIAGPSGSGKSTILNMIGCIDTPSEGRVVIDGKDVEHLSDTELTRYRRTRIGFIFQSFNLIPVLNVYENIEFPLLVSNGHTRKERERIVMRFVEEVQLGDRLKNKPNELSGGQRQRVGVARALAGDPPILLMDEPFGALDPVTRAELQREFRSLASRLKKTIVFVTHDVREALFLASRIALLESGRLVAVYTPEEFLRATEPEARKFVASLQSSRDAESPR
jgi:putative ABC transport system ATP-binding protein